MKNIILFILVIIISVLVVNVVQVDINVFFVGYV